MIALREGNGRQKGFFGFYLYVISGAVVCINYGKNPFTSLLRSFVPISSLLWYWVMTETTDVRFENFTNFCNKQIEASGTVQRTCSGPSVLGP